MKELLKIISRVLPNEIILLLIFNTIDIIYPNSFCHILTNILFLFVVIDIIIGGSLMIYVFFNNKRENRKNDNN